MLAPVSSSSETIAFTTDELLALARIDIERDRLEAALLKPKQVLVLDALPAEAISMAARLYAQLGLAQRARELFKRYLELHPGALQETFELGMTYFQHNELAQAKDYWQQLLQVYQTHPPALFYAGVLAAREGRVADAQRSLEVLFASASADNLYVTQGRQFMQTLNQSAAPVAPTSAALPPAYGATEHCAIRARSSDA